MKKIFAISMLSMAIISSCNRPDVPVVESSRRCDLTVSIGSDETKAISVSADDEAKVNNLQVFVFRGDELDAYGSVSNAKEVTVSCTAGDRQVYALVNGPDYSLIATKTDLLATVSKLSNNTLTSFEMFGSKDVSLPVANEVLIDVSRMASRVVLRKITRDMTSAALAAVDFTIDRIYLINVAGDINYGGTDVNALWHNVAKYDNELASLNYDAPSASLTDGNSYANVHCFYAYPNDLSSKTTRLVVEATLGGRTYYYPINMPVMESNKSYEISELVITRPGSDDPDQPVQFSDVPFEVNVLDWNVVPITEGTVI